MDEESISRICVTAFSDSDIVTAKRLLGESLSKSMKTRKRNGKTLRDIDEIICTLKETDPEVLPIFVARDLHKLPPVLFDHVDVTQILKDLVKMREEINTISQSYVSKEQINLLRHDIDNLKRASIVNNFSGNINPKRGACLIDSFEYNSGPMGLHPIGNERDSYGSRCSSPINNSPNTQLHIGRLPLNDIESAVSGPAEVVNNSEPASGRMTHASTIPTPPLPTAGPCYNDHKSTTQRKTYTQVLEQATVIAKVLDSLLDRRLDEHIKIHDAQFGFKSGLSTESAIFCLKQTVQYYTARKTPVYACFLDLSKAFDLVSYSLLWKKLDCETSLPPEVISIFKYWYDNQRNCVKWAGSRSDVYGLQCGVRQGGLSSPKLFNLYMNRLIEELSSTYVGCHVGGVCINNISYADDMVLLSPSIGALRKLLHMCEEYAVSHGLRYNSLKSEFMVFQAGAAGRQRSVPSVTLGGTDLKRVHQFKYLGHWVTDSLSDSVDVERERRAMCVRCNMLARRFRTYGALRVQYNNAFRMLFGLPRHCSASSMFDEAHIDCFYTIIRKRSASLWARVRGNSNGILSALADRWDSPLLRRWLQLHAPATRYLYI
ncbi:hypothetical protein ABMA27_010511 [Loxostege sticticalis]|uniref:Reverse transcriptase domain-containing protein n=1 Tax=Loxostege sticticalis TaxID=481309 RepID=A0ABR3H686_LOXSC